MPSATLADSRLSTPPSRVKDSAVGRTCKHAWRRDDRQLRRRQAVRKLAETAADGLHRQVEQPGRERGQHDRDQHARPGRPQTPQQEDQRGRADADGERRRVEGRQRLAERHELRQQRPGLGTRQLQAAEILELAGQDGDGDAAGEADGHRVRDVADQRAEPQQADQRQHHAGHQDRQQQPSRPNRADGRRHQNDEGAGRPADLIAAAAQRRDQKAADDGGI